MRKLLFLLLFVPFMSYGQGGTIWEQSAGAYQGKTANFGWYNGFFTGYFGIPIGTTATLNGATDRNGFLYFQTSDSTLRVRYNGFWLIAGGGGSSNVVFFSKQYIGGSGTFIDPYKVNNSDSLFHHPYTYYEAVSNKTATASSSTTTYPNWLGVENYVGTHALNIYNSDGTLTGNRIVTVGTDTLQIIGNNPPNSSQYFQDGNSIRFAASQEVNQIEAGILLNPSNYINTYYNGDSAIGDTIQMTASGISIHSTTAFTGNPTGFDISTGVPGIEVSDGYSNLGLFYNSHIDSSTFTGKVIPDAEWIKARIASYPHGSGTVTTITPGYGFTSSTPITTSGTLTIDTTKLQTILNFFPKGDTRYARLSASNTFTGGFTSQYNGGSTYPFTSINNVAVTNTTASGVGVTIQSNTLSWLTGGFVGSLTMTPTANRTITLPDATTTLLGTAVTQNVSNKTLLPSNIYQTGAGTGGTDSVVVKNSGALKAISPTYYLSTSSATSTYVPYTGATGNVTLGTHTITSGGNVINLSAGTQTTQFTDWQTAIGANAANLNSEMYIYGTGHSVDESYGAGGTLGSLTALPALQELRAFAASGYDGSAYNAGGQVSLQFFTKNAWTTSSHSTYALIKTTPIGSLTETPGLLIDNDQSLYAAGPYFVTGDATQSHPNNFGYTNSTVTTIYNSSTNAAAASRMELVGGSLNTGASGSFFTIDGYSLYNSASPRSIQLSGTLVGSGTANHYASTFSVAVSPDNGSLTKVATFGTGTSGIIFPAYTAAGILHNTVTTGVITSSPVSLTADISGILPIANGGTGIATAPALGSIPYGSTSTALAYVAPNTTTTQKFLTETGTGTVGAIPVLFNLFGTANTYTATQTIPNINTAYINNVNNGNETLDGTSSGIVTLQTQANSGTWTWNWPITAGTAGQVLTSQAGGSTAQTWSSVPIMQATADLTAQSAAVSVTTFTVGASTATFNLSGYINITAVTSDVVELQATYTDENNTSQTANFFTQGATSALLSSIGNSAYPPMVIRAKNATVITIKTVLTTSIGSIAYDVGGRIQQL